LHPSLLELKMSKSYFIREYNEENNQQYAANLAVQIFKAALPQEMAKSTEIQEASVVITKEQLFKYWDIFKKDVVLRSYLPYIAKELALLLTVDDRLFSLSSEILPMYFCHPLTT